MPCAREAIRKTAGHAVFSEISTRTLFAGGGGLFSGAVQVQPDVWLYQLSDTGLAVDLTVEVTKYLSAAGLHLRLTVVLQPDATDEFDLGLEEVDVFFL